MSYIRVLSERKYSDGGSMYAFPTGKGDKGSIEFQVPDQATVSRENFVEVMFRILERSDVDFTHEDVHKVREELKLEGYEDE